MCHKPYSSLLLFSLYTTNYLLEQLKNKIVLFTFILVSVAHHFFVVNYIFVWYHIPYVRTISFEHFLYYKSNGNEFSQFPFSEKSIAFVFERYPLQTDRFFSFSLY